MRAHRVCLFAVAALGAAVLAGCAANPTMVTKYDQAKDLENDGKYASAITTYNAFMAEKQYPDLLPLAEYHVARCYRSLGNLPAARAAYKKVIDLYPTSNVAQWSKDELKELDMMKPAMPAKPMQGAMEPMSAMPAR